MCGEFPERDGTVIPLYSVFIGLAVVAVMLRVVARMLTKAYFWWDDFANLFGFVSVDGDQDDNTTGIYRG